MIRGRGMLKREVLYNYPINALNNLTDSEHFESYYNNLPDENEKSKFLEVCDFLKEIRNSLKLSLETNEVCVRFEDMYQTLKDNFELLRPFQNTNIKQLLYFTQVASAVVSVLEELDENILLNWPTKKFVITNELNYQNTYFHLNEESIDKSIFYVDFSFENLFPELADAAGSSTELVFILLNAIQDLNVDVNERFIFVADNDLICEKKALSALKLHLVLSGEFFHERITLNSTPDQSLKNNIVISEPNHQFNDTLQVLSEYNSRKEMLNKYLSIYHTVENFMYRMPIVALGKANGGKMFSMSNFKDLYNAVSDTELLSLIALMSNFYFVRNNENNENNVNHESSDLTDLHAKFCGFGFANDLTPAIINPVLVKLGVRKKKGFYTFEDITKLQKKELYSIFPQIFSKIVYSIRNAIVHNKETEFHLSHSTLCPITILLIEEIVIPTLESIIFTLLTTKNEIVWYKHDTIQLYA
jgi:hypothetical protein